MTGTKSLRTKMKDRLSGQKITKTWFRTSPAPRPYLELFSGWMVMLSKSYKTMKKSFIHKLASFLT